MNPENFEKTARIPLLLQRGRNVRSILRRTFISLTAWLCISILYACATQRHLQKEIANTPRNPQSGVVYGTEARTIPAADAADAVTSRTACLMVHGFMSARSDFADLGERLAARGITVRQLRLPGHGTTPIEFAHLKEGALYQAAEVEYLALAAEYDRVYLVGFSMGGAISTLLASQYRPAGLVLLAPYYGVAYQWYYLLPVEVWHGLFGWTAPYRIRPRFFIKLNNKDNVGKFFFYSTVPSRGVSQLLALGRQARSDETLRQVTCPVLMLIGNDEAASPRRAVRAFGKIASSEKEFIRLRESNHVLLWDYDAEEVKRRVERFILGEAVARSPKSGEQSSK